MYFLLSIKSFKLNQSIPISFYVEEVSEPTGTHSTETTHYRQDDAEANIEERLKVIRSQFRWTTNKLLRNMEDSKCVLLHVIRRNRFGSTDNEGSEPSDDEGKLWSISSFYE